MIHTRNLPGAVGPLTLLILGDCDKEEKPETTEYRINGS